MTTRMPIVFAGHGSPMNAVEQNRWSEGFAALGARIPKPKAILAISAHWYVSGTYLTGDVKPRTIHDFGGFPKALYEIDYPAPGSVDLAKRVRTLLPEEGAALRTDWGLDHGTWSVLKWMVPAADVPVVQLSIDRRQPPSRHVELARSLAALRDEGVLIFGSGNIVHNLRDAFTQMKRGTDATPEWAARFDQAVKSAVEQHDLAALTTTWPDHPDARQSHPTPDHWLPLLYTAAAASADDTPAFPTEGFSLGSISMRNVLWG